MYEIELIVEYKVVATLMLKSITQVAKFLKTIDFDILEVVIYTPKNRMLSLKKVLEVLND